MPAREQTSSNVRPRKKLSPKRNANSIASGSGVTAPPAYTNAGTISGNAFPKSSQSGNRRPHSASSKARRFFEPVLLASARWPCVVLLARLRLPVVAPSFRRNATESSNSEKRRKQKRSEEH